MMLWARAGGEFMESNRLKDELFLYDTKEQRMVEFK